MSRTVHPAQPVCSLHSVCLQQEHTEHHIPKYTTEFHHKKYFRCVLNRLTLSELPDNIRTRHPGTKQIPLPSPNTLPVVSCAPGLLWQQGQGVRVGVEEVGCCQVSCWGLIPKHTTHIVAESAENRTLCTKCPNPLRHIWNKIKIHFFMCDLLLPSQLIPDFIFRK